MAECNIRYADLDGHLELASDPCEGGVSTVDGENRVPEGPGLVASVRTGLLRKGEL
jgi:hypothetical protein